MLIDVNLDNHILEIDRELESFNYIEFRSRFKSVFGLSVILSKDKLKNLTVILRVCMDYLKDNIDKIKENTYDLTKTIDYINHTLDCGDIKKFKVYYDSFTGEITYNIIITLEDTTDEFSINQTMCYDELKYLSIVDVADMLHIVKK